MLPIDAMSESLTAEVLAGLEDVELSLAKLYDAEESLATMKTDGPDPLLVALRETELAAAELDLEAAQQRLQGTVLTSPIRRRGDGDKR